MFAQAARETRALLGVEADYFLLHDEQGNTLHLSPFKRWQVSPEASQDFKRSVLKTGARKLRLEEYLGTHRVISVGALNAFIVGINIHEVQMAYTPKNLKPVYNAWYTYDHEEAHTLIQNARSNTPGSPHFKETVADTYAMLRHIQRFGKRTGFPVFQAQLAATILASAPEYYTSDAIMAVATLAETLPIEGLSRKMTLALAETIAKKYMVEEKTLGRLASAFRPLAGVSRYTKDDFAEVGCAHPEDREIQKACTLAAQYVEATAQCPSHTRITVISQKVS